MRDIMLALVRRDWVYLFIICAVAFAVRVYAPWSAVFAGDRIDFLETDSWYHVRLIENQVRNWPWRVTVDPYAAPGGQFVPIAPFFDTITATAAVIAYGRDAAARQIERIAVFVPPILGTLTIVVLWALARHVFDRRAALIGAGLLAVLPGHFLDRTLLGFYDHHALEACLAVATLLAFARRQSVLSGIVLGLYLLGWSSGALLVGVLGLWLLLFVPLSKGADDLSTTARIIGVAALVALVMVVVFQDPRMHRYGGQLLALVGLVGVALAIRLTAGHVSIRLPRTRSIYGALAVIGAVAGAVVWWVSPGPVMQLVMDMRRLAPNPGRMAVLEARPLFLYSGTFHWQQPWEFFRTGFFIGLIALLFFARQVWRERRPIDVLIWVFTAVMFAATIGQNRFGYYLVPACALVGGWLAAHVLEWRREIGVVIVAGMFAPNLAPAVLVASRAGSLPQYWHDTMVWIRDHTPAPFVNAAHAGEEYYYARYPREAVPPPDYSIMNWWDHGYWIAQIARRVPVANPTQERAPNAAQFYASADERQALDILRRARSRYVVIDWELPFRLTPDGVVMGRFQSVVDWAGAEHARYYQVFYQRESNAWRTVWVFHEPYYQSMTTRLMVLAGRPAIPSGSTSVIVVVDRVDENGMRFGEIVSQTTYDTYEAAVEAASGPSSAGRTLIVGLDPWRPAFPVRPLAALAEVHATRTPGQKANEAPWVRVFELR